MTTLKSITLEAWPFKCTLYYYKERKDPLWDISCQGQEIPPAHRPHLPDQTHHSPESQQIKPIIVMGGKM